MGENESQIEAKVEGEDSKIAFNSKYLSEVLDNLLEDNISNQSSDSLMKNMDDLDRLRINKSF